jgi:hypothetical protein
MPSDRRGANHIFALGGAMWLWGTLKWEPEAEEMDQRRDDRAKAA